jgi:hypothetical protein
MVIHYCVLTRIMTRLGRQSCTPHHVRSLASMSILLRDHGISLGCAKIPVDSPLHLEMKQIVASTQFIRTRVNTRRNNFKP